MTDEDKKMEELTNRLHKNGYLTEDEDALLFELLTGEPAPEDERLNKDH